MTLYDQIIDEAEQLASERILNDPTDHAIIDAVSDIVGVKLGYRSTGGMLALASYNHKEAEMNRMVVAA